MATTPREDFFPAMTPESLQVRLTAMAHQVRALESDVRVCLDGSDRDHALEIAASVEAVARAVAALQLEAARAVDERAASSVLSDSILVDHRGDLARKFVGDDDGVAAVSDGAPAPECRDRSDVSPAPFHRSVDLLAARLRLPRREASRRVRLARQVLPRLGLDGQEHPAPRAHAAGVLHEVDPAALRHLLRASGRAGQVGGPDLAAAVEQHLATQARIFDLDTLARLADRVIAHLDPDGPPPADPDRTQHRGVTIGRVRDGLTPARLLVTGPELEILQTVFDAGTNPRPHRLTPHERDGDSLGAASDAAAGSRCGSTADDSAAGGGESDVQDISALDREARTPDGSVVASTAPAETPTSAPVEKRSRARRMLDALIAACGAAMRAEALPATGGLPTQVVVTIPLASLTGRAIPTGTAWDRWQNLNPSEPPCHRLPGDDAEASFRSSPEALLRRSPASVPTCPAASGSAVALGPPPDVPVLPHAGPVPISQVRHLACDADLIPAVLGTDSRILDLGRSHRLVPAWMRTALVARDGGCTFPACTVPAAWCEAHHLVPWYRGGVTSLENTTLLCPAHHHQIDSGHWAAHRTPAGRLTFTPPWSATPGLTHNPHHRGA